MKRVIWCTSRGTRIIPIVRDFSVCEAVRLLGLPREILALAPHLVHLSEGTDRRRSRALEQSLGELFFFVPAPVDPACPRSPEVDISSVSRSGQLMSDLGGKKRAKWDDDDSSGNEYVAADDDDDDDE